MKVYVAEGSLYCSKECVLVEHEVSARPWLLPGRQRNGVLDLLLGRATCDTCGFNLEDVQHEVEKRAQEAKNQDALYRAARRQYDAP